MAEEPKLDKFVVIFHTKKGAALREIMQLGHADPRLDNRTFNRVARKGRKIGASYFTILIAVPRLWGIEYDTECMECRHPIL